MSRSSMSRRVQLLERYRQRTGRPIETAQALDLNETCRRIGLSRRTAERLLADGRFPVPELPRVGRQHRFSEIEVALYLAEASVADAR